MTNSHQSIELVAGPWRLGLRPDLGSAITELTLDRRPILRPTPPSTDEPLDHASFPLLPYANRIEDGRLRVGGKTYLIPRNHAGQDHPLHGLGWLRPWQIAERSAAHIVLTQEHDGDADWPFAYQARQVITVDPDGVTFTLAITNRHATAVPVSLGFHPYFVTTPDMRLRFEATSVWLADARLMPTGTAPADRFGDFASSQPMIRNDLLDNSYEGWGGTAFIECVSGQLRLSATGAELLHIYMPPGADFFCAEPVTSFPDGVNRRPELLPPGATREMAMRIDRPA